MQFFVDSADINEIKADVKQLSREAGVEVRHQVEERRRVQARDKRQGL